MQQSHIVLQRTVFHRFHTLNTLYSSISPSNVIQLLTLLSVQFIPYVYSETPERRSRVDLMSWRDPSAPEIFYTLYLDRTLRYHKMFAPMRYPSVWPISSQFRWLCRSASRQSSTLIQHGLARPQFEKRNPSQLTRCLHVSCRRMARAKQITLEEPDSESPRSRNEAMEEWTLPQYDPAKSLQVRIGDVFQSTYRVVTKLGFGTSCTVWLCRNIK